MKVYLIHIFTGMTMKLSSGGPIQLIEPNMIMVMLMVPWVVLGALIGRDGKHD